MIDSKHGLSEPPSADLDRALLSAIIAGSEDAIISKTLGGVITSWNAAAERLFGWTAPEMLGTPVLQLIPVELHFEEDHILGRLRAGERIERYETTRLRKDGSRIDVSLTISPIRDSAGNIVGASKIVHDISDRRRKDAALAALASEGHALETLSRVGGSVASEFELDVIVQRITDAATELSGAAFGAFFYNVSDQDEGDSYRLYALSGVPHESFSNFPMPRVTDIFGPTFRGEGSVRSEDIRTDPRFGRNAPFFGMPEDHLPVVSYLAVSVRSKEGSIIGGLFLGHPDRNRFSERAERIVLGIANQAAIAIDNSRLVQKLKDREAALSQFLAERDGLLESERVARSEAERLAQVKDEFLATLSHELRTPLNAVLGWTVLLRRLEPGSDQFTRGLETIERNARAQAKIIEDLLDMSRIISGKIQLEVQPLDAAETVRTAVEGLRPAVEAKRIHLTTTAGTRVSPILGDPNRLQQVLWNLLTNAAKFTPEGGSIHVDISRVRTTVEIRVKDSGAGIAQGFLPHVFGRFRQADASPGRSQGGLGLGLAIVKNLVELHGGTVRAHSDGEGHGSTFVVALPLSSALEGRWGSQAIASAPTVELPPLELPSLEHIRVLVVDDQADARELIERFVVDRHGKVKLAASAEEALDILWRDDIDVIVSDIGMPGVDGYEFMRRVRALPIAAAQIPAIALTAYARAEDRSKALKSGFQIHVTKPLEPRELVAAISSLAKPRAN